jgi:hypothetical protein
MAKASALIVRNDVFMVISPQHILLAALRRRFIIIGRAF